MEKGVRTGPKKGFVQRKEGKNRKKENAVKHPMGKSPTLPKTKKKNKREKGSFAGKKHGVQALLQPPT